MGQADWNDLGNSLTTAALARGVTAGLTPPNSSITNAFVYGYNSLDGNVAGAHGKYVDLTGFTPTGSGPANPDGGGSIRGCVKRVPSTNVSGFSPFLFFCAAGSPPAVEDQAYMLGLLDADPYEIVLAKGLIIGGLVEAPEGSEELTILARSSSQYNIGDDLWQHLRLDVLVQPNGDVLLKCFENDLNNQPIGDTPDWQNINGFDPNGFIDDAIQIATGSPPLLGGYCGFAFAYSTSINRRGAFDAIEAYRAA